MADVLILPVAPRERLREVHSYGYAAGLVLVLMLDTYEGAHMPLRLAVVGPEPLLTETLASFHHTAEGAERPTRRQSRCCGRCSLPSGPVQGAQHD